MKRRVVYDIECLKNLFTYTGLDIDTGEIFQYAICRWQTDQIELCQHLSECDIMYGYNNWSYDYTVLHSFMKHYKEYLYLNGEMCATRLYEKSQETISSKFSRIAPKNMIIKQVDLFAVSGFDSIGKYTSLKDLEFNMRLPKIEDMPIHHTHYCSPGDEEIVLKYNLNDVIATNEYRKIIIGDTELSNYKGDNQIELREKLSKKFKINLINTSDIRLGEAIVLKLYCDKTGKDIQSIKNVGGTRRGKINLKDCIPSWAKFEMPEFQKVYDKFYSSTVNGEELKGALSFTTIVHGVELSYGLGGLHASATSKVYESNEEWIIIDQDIALQIMRRN